MPVTIEGKVAGFHESAEERGTGDFKRAIRVWDFRVEAHDRQGDLTQIVPVQLKGQTFTGLVEDGDDVRVTLPTRWNGADTVVITGIDRLLAVGDQARVQRIRAIDGCLPRLLLTIAIVFAAGLLGVAVLWFGVQPV